MSKTYKLDKKDLEDLGELGAKENRKMKIKRTKIKKEKREFEADILEKELLRAFQPWNYSQPSY